MRQLLYYADNSTQYFLRNEEVHKYFMKTRNETAHIIGGLDTLKVLADIFKKFYVSNKENILLVNCNDSLKDMGFRSLTASEEKTLLDVLKGE